MIMGAAREMWLGGAGMLVGAAATAAGHAT